MNRTLGAQVGHLALRSIVRTLRQPASVIPPLVFPLMLLAVNTGGLDAATHLPGFPADSFLSFALAVPFIQGGLFATMNAGTDLAKDIQTGFLDRLALTPMRGAALLLGQIAGVVVLGVVQALAYLGVGLAAGAGIASGVAGAVVLLALSTLIVLGFASVGAFMALRTGSGEAVQGLFPLLFVFLFISSMNMPRDLIEIDWFRIVATLNPVSYLIEGIRSLIVTGWDAEALVLGFGTAAIVAVVGLVFAASALRLRLTRT